MVAVEVKLEDAVHNRRLLGIDGQALLALALVAERATRAARSVLADHFVGATEAAVAFAATGVAAAAFAGAFQVVAASSPWRA